MRIHRIGREANQLDAALGELGFQLRKCAEFGRANRGVVFGVGEEDDPVVANELMEVDGAGSGVGLEVRGNRAKTKSTTCIRSKATHARPYV